jgi:hypothetical protein
MKSDIPNISLSLPPRPALHSPATLSGCPACVVRSSRMRKPGAKITTKADQKPSTKKTPVSPPHTLSAHCTEASCLPPAAAAHRHVVCVGSAATRAPPATTAAAAATTIPSHLVQTRVNLLLGLLQHVDEVAGLLRVWIKVSTWRPSKTHHMPTHYQW